MLKRLSLVTATSLLLVLLGTAGFGRAPNTLQITAGSLRRHLLRNGTSGNWSGYAVETNLTSPQKNTVSNVQAQWTVPTVTCSSRINSYSSVWIGIDGYSDNTVEQTGTEQDCSRGRAQYYAWYEMYPRAMSTVRLTVSPGDVIVASVQFSGTNAYTLTLNDKTTGKSYATTQLLNGAGRQSAEWVVEAPSSYGGVLPLANFGTASLTGASATLNGHTGSISDTAWQKDPITMQTANGTPKAVPSPLSPDGTSFTATWKHS